MGKIGDAISKSINTLPYWGSHVTTSRVIHIACKVGDGVAVKYCLAGDLAEGHTDVVAISGEFSFYQ